MPETPRRVKCHEIKSWPESFEPIRAQDKTFEIRENDRGYQTGDYLLMYEWNPETEQYTGRTIMALIGYVALGKWGLPVNLCAMQITVLHCAESLQYVSGPTR
jgi:hypothetical protein